MKICNYLLISVLLLSNSCKESPRFSASNDFPQAVTVKSFKNCYDAVGFFRVSKEEINRKLPKGFVARDGGEVLGEDFKGYAYLLLIYFSCPVVDNPRMQVAIIATPVEDPAFAKDMRNVRWNLYEFGRIVTSKQEADILNTLGFSAQESNLSNSPFHEGDTTTSFQGEVADGILFKVDIKLTDSVNFEAQSHRLWHQRSDNRLISSRWDFEYHHSWIGKFNSCSFNPDVLSIADLKGIECTGIGITEAIEKINFTENIMVWR